MPRGSAPHARPPAPHAAAGGRRTGAGPAVQPLPAEGDHVPRERGAAAQAAVQRAAALRDSAARARKHPAARRGRRDPDGQLHAGPQLPRPAQPAAGSALRVRGAGLSVLRLPGHRGQAGVHTVAVLRAVRAVPAVWPAGEGRREALHAVWVLRRRVRRRQPRVPEPAVLLDKAGGVPPAVVRKQPVREEAAAHFLLAADRALRPEGGAARDPQGVSADYHVQLRYQGHPVQIAERGVSQPVQRHSATELRVPGRGVQQEGAEDRAVQNQPRRFAGGARVRRGNRRPRAVHPAANRPAGGECDAAEPGAADHQFRGHQPVDRVLPARGGLGGAVHGLSEVRRVHLMGPRPRILVNHQGQSVCAGWSRILVTTPLRRHAARQRLTVRSYSQLNTTSYPKL